MESQPKIILASQSPQRLNILRNAGYEPIVSASQYPEIDDPNLTPTEQALEHAIQKAKEVAKQFNEGIVIGCDTLIDLDGKVIGKAQSEAQAKHIIKSQQGREIKVISGLCLINTQNGQIQTHTETTIVTFATMTEAEIDWYINTNEWKDKSGAFSIQGLGSRFIAKIEGDYQNVVGLPLHQVYKMLNNS
jgi:septum formation protein